MATVRISCVDYSITIPTNDVGVTQVVQSLSKAFSAAGGAWVGGDTDAGDGASSALRWFPAAGTTVVADFDDGSIPAGLSDMPGFLR